MSIRVNMPTRSRDYSRLALHAPDSSPMKRDMPKSPTFTCAGWHPSPISMHKQGSREYCSPEHGDQGRQHLATAAQTSRSQQVRCGGRLTPCSLRNRLAGLKSRCMTCGWWACRCDPPAAALATSGNNLSMFHTAWAVLWMSTSSVPLRARCSKGHSGHARESP